MCKRGFCNNFCHKKISFFSQASGVILHYFMTFYQMMGILITAKIDSSSLSFIFYYFKLLRFACCVTCRPEGMSWVRQSQSWLSCWAEPYYSLFSTLLLWKLFIFTQLAPTLDYSLLEGLCGIQFCTLTCQHSLGHSIDSQRIFVVNEEAC